MPPTETLPAAPLARFSGLVEAAVFLGLPSADVSAYALWRAGTAAESAVLPAEARRVRRAS